MKKTNFILLFLFNYIVITAQVSYSLEYEYEDFLSNTPSTAYLLINENEAVFKVNDDRASELKINNDKQEGNDISVTRVNNDELSSFTYSDNNTIFIRTLGIKEREFIYKFDIADLDWKFTEETKKISTYQCQKATLNLHGRDYEVWFTTEVPITFGPMRLNGLPGMVVEVAAYYPNDTIKNHWKLVNIKKNMDQKAFTFHKDFFSTKKVLAYNKYEKEAIQNMVDKKIYQLAKTAAIAAKWAEEDGYESEYRVTYEPPYFFDYFIDIPDGAWEELEKINQ